MERLWIVGAGAFGREVFDWARQVNAVRPTWEFAGFLDDASDALAGRPCDLDVLRPLSDAKFEADDVAIVAIGSPEPRRRVVERLGANVRYATLIHPTAVVGSDVALGPGCILCPHSVVSVGAVLGAHVVVNLASDIGADAALGDFVTLSCHCSIGRGATVGEAAFLGSHVAVESGVCVGAEAKLGAGTAVLEDCKPGATYYGVPARMAPTLMR